MCSCAVDMSDRRACSLGGLPCTACVHLRWTLNPTSACLFCVQVTVDVPDQKGRREILGVHARNKKLSGDVDLQEVAMRTPGFAGADLSNLLNEAAILAGRRGLQAISNQEIDDAVDR